MRETQPDAWLVGLQSSASYAKGLWLRLNGSPVDSGQPASAILAALPRPTQPDREQRAAKILGLSQSIDALEKRLQETSKVSPRTARVAQQLGGRWQGRQATQRAKLRTACQCVLTLTATLRGRGSTAHARWRC